MPAKVAKACKSNLKALGMYLKDIYSLHKIKIFRNVLLLYIAWEVQLSQIGVVSKREKGRGQSNVFPFIYIFLQ